MDDGQMAALRTAKQELRALMHKKLAEVPEHSVAEQSTAIVKALLSMPKYEAASRIGIYLSMPRGEVMTQVLVKDALAQGKEVFVPYIFKAPPQKGLPGLVEWKGGKLMEMVALHSSDDYCRIERNRDAWGIPSVEDESISGRHKILGEASSVWRAKMPWTDSEPAQTRFGPEQKYLDMIIMPGLAFDRECGRLGHGKGFYDCFLKRYCDSKVLGADRASEYEHRKRQPLLVGLALNEQTMPVGQAIPRGPSDWPVDALITGDGSVIESSNF